MKSKLTITILALAFIMLGATGAIADWDEYKVGFSVSLKAIADTQLSQSGFRVDSTKLDSIEHIKPMDYLVNPDLFGNSSSPVSVLERAIFQDGRIERSGQFYAETNFGNGKLTISVEKQKDSIFSVGKGVYRKLAARPEYSGETFVDTFEVRGPDYTSFFTPVSFVSVQFNTGLIEGQELFVPKYEIFERCESMTQSAKQGTEEFKEDGTEPQVEYLIMGLDTYSASREGFGLTLSGSPRGSILHPEDFEVSGSVYLFPGAVATNGFTFNPISLDNLRTVVGDLGLGSLDTTTFYKRTLPDKSK